MHKMFIYQPFPIYLSTPSEILIPQNSIIELKTSNVTDMTCFIIPAFPGYL